MKTANGQNLQLKMALAGMTYYILLVTKTATATAISTSTLIASLNRLPKANTVLKRPSRVQRIYMRNLM